MDTQLEYRKLIKKIISEYAALKPAHGEIDSRPIFDDEQGSYALLQTGWDSRRYIHGTVIHIDLIGDKIWIQYDGTETGIANELAEAGVPKNRIVLGFRSEKLRPYTEFATG